MSESKSIVIRSGSNAKIRHIVRMRDNRARRAAGRVLVDGWRETAHALEAGLQLRQVYLPESVSDDPPGESDAKRVMNATRRPELLTWVSDALMSRIAYGQSNRGVVAEFERPTHALADLRLSVAPFLLVLDRIEKPGNIGAVFRCAEAAGVEAILLSDSGDALSPNAIRSSLGCVFHVPFAVGTEKQVSEFLRCANIDVVAARTESSDSLWSASLDPPLAVVLGSESQGLGQRWQNLGDHPIRGVRIPMQGVADSLNVSVTAAVICYESLRRRGRDNTIEGCGRTRTAR